MIISLDTEYSEIDVDKADLLSISIGTATSEVLFKPYQIEEVRKIINGATVIFMQNGIVDYKILKRYGLKINREVIIDTMLLEHLIDERLEHNLGAMSLRYFNDNYKSEFWAKYDNFQDASPVEAHEYERKDARYTFDLGVKFLDLLRNKMKLIEHVHKLHWCLCDIELTGIKIDTELLAKTDKEMSEQINSMLPKLRSQYDEYCTLWEYKEWEKEITKRSTTRGKLGVDKPVFSFTSDKQVGTLLYDSNFLGLVTESKTKKGSPSTSYDTLEELSKSYPIIQPIVDFKDAKAVYGTFVKGLSERIVDGKVHPHFSVNGTTTGRLSSSNPNFQNMPQDGVIRNFILPDSGCVIVGADYSSLEVFIEGNLTEDPNLLKIMFEGVSKHDITAAAVGMSRKDAKTLNFLCQYGGGVWKIQKTFGVSEKTAQEIFDKYWIAYAGVMDYKKKVFKELADTNQVINHFGRVRHFDPPKNKWEMEAQQRQAYSHMVQGPGAEMTNFATYTLQDRLKTFDFGRVMFCVHDELVCSIKKDIVEDAKSVIVGVMEEANDFLGFKHRIKSVPYGPLTAWAKV